MFRSARVPHAASPSGRMASLLFALLFAGRRLLGRRIRRHVGRAGGHGGQPCRIDRCDVDTERDPGTGLSHDPDRRRGHRDHPRGGAAHDRVAGAGHHRDPVRARGRRPDQGQGPGRLPLPAAGRRRARSRHLQFGRRREDRRDVARRRLRRREFVHRPRGDRQAPEPGHRRRRPVRADDRRRLQGHRAHRPGRRAIRAGDRHRRPDARRVRRRQGGRRRAPDAAGVLRARRDRRHLRPGRPVVPCPDDRMGRRDPDHHRVDREVRHLASSG